jgi:hypothetical protein
MDGDTTRAHAAARELTDTTYRNELRRELVSEGVYHVVVEGGYHTRALTDAEADHLCRLFITGGLERWEEYAAELTDEKK